MKVEQPRLCLGIPKGSLQETTTKLFALAGFDLRISGRSYYPDIDDQEIECILIRPQEMARYVEQGILDCAITGLDWVLETGADVVELTDLKAPWPNYGTVRWVMASKADSSFDHVTDLEGKHIATEAVGMTQRFLQEHGVEASVEFSWGATEVKPPVLADAIVDVTETGSSLRANQLKVMHVVLESTPRFIANHESLKDGWKKDKMNRLLMLLNGAIAAATRVTLAMNVPKAKLEAILALLPALGTPTVSTLADEGWFDVSTVVEEKQVRDLIPTLSETGPGGSSRCQLPRSSSKGSPPTRAPRSGGYAASRYHTHEYLEGSLCIVPLHQMMGMRPRRFARSVSDHLPLMATFDVGLDDD